MVKLNWISDLGKVEFIVEQALERRKALLARDYSKLSEDLFQDINDSVLGIVPIGRAAMKTLDELCLSAITFAGLNGRVAILTARRKLGPLLVQLFIRQELPISQQTLQRAYQLSEADMRAALVTRTHLLPCHIVDGKEPQSIAIGPVTFLNRAAARALLRQTVAEHVQGNAN